MKAEIELECKEPKLVVTSLQPDKEELNKFDVKLTPGKNKLILEIEAEDISGLLAGINSYMRLIKVAIDAMEI
jgi:tRNA threonylcarbamoyladenosine modification (KEOPS) complex  Pcc1 subunit